MPPIILWELWRSGCSSKYELENPALNRSISMITFNISSLAKSYFRKIAIPDDRENLCKLLEQNMAETSTILVRWIKPPLLFVKLNTHGTWVQGIFGGGGVVRDKLGRFIMAFTLPLGQGTSNTTEASSFLFGLEWCIRMRYYLVIGETDSMLLQNCISKKVATLWRLEETMKKIRRIVNDHDIITRHCFREVNKVMDNLASLSYNTDEIQIFTQFNRLPSQIRGVLNVDRWQLPSFRVKKRKPGVLIFEPP
ncbi:hypothetical protein A4A49_55186 [Nicotiana attenuata]|uniref:RNase H type-1 domain-containing protein n=1 Tax=Nicotiana attenuata TaxID=49451 RepID=A0A1J6JPA7_NICAT|nr:hypothetical protein A4A49_55186 [Nicotiana attenuata]